MAGSRMETIVEKTGSSNFNTSETLFNRFADIYAEITGETPLNTAINIIRRSSDFFASQTRRNDVKQSGKEAAANAF